MCTIGAGGSSAGAAAGAGQAGARPEGGERLPQDTKRHAPAGKQPPQGPGTSHEEICTYLSG